MKLPPPPTAGRREITGLSVIEDQALSMIAALASELAVARERIDTLERLLDANGTLPRAQIEAYRAEGEAAQQREGLRHNLIAKVFRPLRDASRRALEG
ncbi:hypothetical protein [Novosphingobium sp.]|uniref:hypothetical protein n=1 Tax=Novosphingobium sp. TaxID=1874826 RepID=UPI0031D9B60F